MSDLPQRMYIMTITTDRGTTRNVGIAYSPASAMHQLGYRDYGPNDSIRQMTVEDWDVPTNTMIGAYVKRPHNLTEGWIWLKMES